VDRIRIDDTARLVLFAVFFLNGLFSQNGAVLGWKSCPTAVDFDFCELARNSQRCLPINPPITKASNKKQCDISHQNALTH